MCYYSDLARLTGGGYSESDGFGEYWIDGQVKSAKSKTLINYMNYIDVKGYPHSTTKTTFSSGVRIAFSFDDVEDFNISNIDDLVLEYPLTIISGNAGASIDKLFEKQSKLLIRTGRTHIVGNGKYTEYQAFGIKFIRKSNKVKSKVLSDGTISDANTTIYLRVEKIPLTVDEEARLIYSSIVLFSDTFDSNIPFEKSKLCRFLNTDFLQSINDELEHTKPEVAFQNENDANISNRYGFDFTPISEEEIIEICIKSNIAVFLHGATGTGKTERMVALDRNLELVDFGCTSSDGFTGIVAKDFNSKELFLYEPYWYKSLCEKCEAEPDKIHILFLEELTNAKNDLQKVAFEVTLNKTLTNSGFRLKLPKNAVVCAAGNESNESKSASPLSEPLFGRFAHVYINTVSEEWLKWAVKRKKEGKELLYKEPTEYETIHPAIIDYIRINGDKVLRTSYDGIKPNADPRKWALASKALYESNNPNVLRAFIGETLTQDFIKFCKMNLITVEDVINDKCEAKDIPYNTSLRWSIVVCLSSVDDKNVEKVREFVNELGKEYLAIFDYEWSKDNDQRILKLYEKYEQPLVRKITQNENRRNN